MSNNNLKIVPRHEVEQAAWDSFVNNCDEAWLWHLYDFQDAISTWPGKSDLSFAIKENGSQEILAVVPLHITKEKIYHVISWDKLDSMGGPAFKNKIGDSFRQKLISTILAHLQNIAEKQGAVEINIALSPMAPASRGEKCPQTNPLLKMKCENTLTQTWVIDLRQGEKNIWDGMEKRARNAVRKAEKMNVICRLANQDSDLDAYYRLHSETYGRSAINPHPKDYFKAIWTDFYAKDLALILVAEINGEIVAADNFGIYKNAAIYWTGASSQKGLESQAGSLLQWIAMRHMIENSLEWYETGEAFPHVQEGKLKGLNDFKQEFGGKLYPYYRGRFIFKRKANWVYQSLSNLKKALFVE